MEETVLATQVGEAKLQLIQSQKLVRGAPSPYYEILIDSFAQLDTTLEELRVADEEMRQQCEALTEIANALAEERARYRDLFEFAPSAYLVTDYSGVILDCNKVACIMLNVIHRALIQKSLFSFVYSADRCVLTDDLCNLKHLLNISARELIIRPRRGQPFVASITLSAKQSGSEYGDVVRWLITDISDRKGAKERILESTFESEDEIQDDDCMIDVLA